MLKPEQVPIEVMNAFHLALLHDESYAEAIAAAINAWPGWEGSWDEANGLRRVIILPMPTESRDE